MSTPNSASRISSSISLPATHTVAVGKGGFTYVPDTTYAAVGDKILFQFYPSNHSVIQSLYGYPCIPANYVIPGEPIFNSGFEPVDTTSESLPSFAIRVADTNPIFYYCGAPNSCIGQGMVGVINPNASQNVETQRYFATHASIMLVPGQDWPGESPSSTTTMSSSAIATATETVSQTSAAAVHTRESALSGGAVAGIVVGVLIAAVVAGLLLHLWCLRRKEKHLINSSSKSVPNISGPLEVQSSNMISDTRSLPESLSTHAYPGATSAMSEPVSQQYAYKEWHGVSDSPGPAHSSSS